jgi:hypothetical protein
VNTLCDRCETAHDFTRSEQRITCSYCGHSFTGPVLDPYDAAVEYARKRGQDDGTNAAGWYVQDAFGGRVTHGADESARRILKGIEDGDSAVSDGFPYADLSALWADSLTGRQLMDDARYAAGLRHEDRHDLYAEPFRGSCEACTFASDAFSDICDAYVMAFSDAVQDEIARAARYHLEPVE